jgi:hypothetical protein
VNAGEIYIVHTALTKPAPKDKIVLCICAVDNFFVWINTKAAAHGIGQFPLHEPDHGSLNRDCFLDLSRVTTFPPRELANAQARGPINADLAGRLLAHVQANPPKTLSKRYLDLLLATLQAVAS